MSLNVKIEASAHGVRAKRRRTLAEENALADDPALNVAACNVEASSSEPPQQQTADAAAAADRAAIDLLRGHYGGRSMAYAPDSSANRCRIDLAHYERLMVHFVKPALLASPSEECQEEDVDSPRMRQLEAMYGCISSSSSAPPLPEDRAAVAEEDAEDVEPDHPPPTAISAGQPPLPAARTAAAKQAARTAATGAVARTNEPNAQRMFQTATRSIVSGDLRHSNVAACFVHSLESHLFQPSNWPVSQLPIYARALWQHKKASETYLSEVELLVAEALR